MGVPMTIHVFPKHAIDLAVDELVFVSDNETIYQITVRTVVTIQNPTSVSAKSLLNCVRMSSLLYIILPTM